MFGLRSARGRATFVGLVLTLFLVGVTALTVWRNEGYNHQLDKLERASDAAAALEHARAQLYLQTSLLSGLAFSQDASLVDGYRQAQAALEQDLIQARSEATTRGDAAQLAILDDLSLRTDEFEATANLAIPLLLQIDAPAAAELTTSYLPSVWDEVGAMFADLDRLAEDGRAHLAAERAAMDDEADVTFWLIVARSAAAFLLTAGIATVVLLSILRPLASVRLSAKAIAAGNLNARAKVFGPEEVASLARDFNRMTDALAVKTKEYITTTNLTGDVIGKVDAQGKWTFLNDAACQFYGKPRERLLGTDALAPMHPDDREATAQAVQEARANKEPRKGLVNRVVTPLGTRVVEWNAYPVFDGQGRDLGIQITGRDVTERKEAEEALRQAEQRYRSLFEDAPVMYVVCRNQGGAPFVADCNELFVTALGHGRDEVIGRPVADFYTPESRAQLLEGGGFQRALTGQFVAEERQLVTKDGRVVETTLRAVPEFGSDGRVLGTRAMYVDITERKRMEDALRESEGRYRLLAENTTDLIWTMDLSLRYTYMSPAVTRMRGYSVEEIVGTTVQETMTPASLEVARKTLAEQLVMEREGADPNRSTKLELEMYCKDGSTIWTEMNMTFLRDADGRPTGILGVTRDITERKQTEQALEESEKRYRLIAEYATDLIWTTDMSLRYTYVSPSVQRLRGYTVEEAMVHKVEEDLCPSSFDLAMRVLAEEVAREGSHEKAPYRWRTLELEHYCKDGSTIWLEVTTTFMRDEDGRPVGLLGSSRDISERRQAAKALEESEKRYRLLAENASDIIWTMDMNLRFTYESPSVTRIRGYSPEEAMALTMEETLSPASLEVATKALAEELAPGKMETAELSRSRTLELEHTCKDGSTVWLEVTTTFLRDADGRPIGLLGVSRDMSERRRAAEALEDSEKRYRLLAENVSDVIFTTDLGLRYTYVSPSVTRMRGYSVEEVMAGTLADSLAPHSLEEARRVIAEELVREREGKRVPSRTVEVELNRKDGSTIWTEVTANFLRDPDGKPIGLLGVSRDITERKQAEEQLLRQRAVLDMVNGVLQQTLTCETSADVARACLEAAKELTASKFGFIGEINEAGRFDTIALTNPGWEACTIPVSNAERLIKDMEIRGIWGRALTDRKPLIVNDPPSHPDWVGVPEGHPPLTSFLGVPLRHRGKTIGMIALANKESGYDVADQEDVETLAVAFVEALNRKRADEERNRLNAELEARAVTDSLTGLYNHAFFYQRLADEIDRAKRYGHRFALVMMDVDAFKHYNDSRGHQAGDAALRLVGECILSAMRRSDLAFRYGGDEFVALLLDADVSKGQDVVRRINRRIATRLKEAGDSAGAWLGVSGGIACYPADATTVDELIGMADAAMYDAKRLAWARGVMGRRQAVEAAAGPVNAFDEAQVRVLSGEASSLSAALQDLAGPNTLAESELRTIATLGAAAEIRDPFIRGHQERTSRLATTVANEMGLAPDRVRNLATAGLLHDLGKVSVGEGILNKPGKLSESEFAKMKEHPALGASMIASGAGAFQPLAPIVRHHHERFDGSGYPDGLARENIPLEARILSVADAFDAMTHERAYRKALSMEEALGEIERGAGTRFDQAVVQAFLGVMRRRGGQPG